MPCDPPTRFVASLGAAALAVACQVGPDAPRGRADADAPDHPAVTAEAPSPPTACPGSDFGTFLDAFAEDPTLQRRYTRLPLPVTTMDEGPDGPRPLERLLPADSIPWPVLLSAATRAAEGLELTIDSTAAGQWRVTAAKPDTDYQLEYTFMRDDERGACWYLVRYENASL